MVKIRCLYKGCKGIIDLDKELEFFGNGENKPIQLPWCTHTIICPECHNPVGHIGISPGSWVNPKTDVYTIHDPTNKKKGFVVTSNKNSLNPYLKRWAKHQWRDENLEQMKERHQDEIEELQKHCPHKFLTKWMDEWWAMGHSTGYRVRCCKRCGEIRHRQTWCRVCGKEIIDDGIKRGGIKNKNLFYRSPYCQTCYKKGDPEAISLQQLIDEDEEDEKKQKGKSNS